LLDERFFLVFEDSDWCYRAKAKGYKCIFVPTALVWHKVAASFAGEESPLRTYFRFRNCLLWSEKNLGWIARGRVHLRVYSGFNDRFIRPLRAHHGTGEPSLRRLYWTLKGSLRSPLNQAWLCALRDYWLRRFGNCPSKIYQLNKIWLAQKAAAAGVSQ